MYTRLLPTPTRSVFLFGPRGTGKSTWIRDRFPDTDTYDLLDTGEALRLTKGPARTVPGTRDSSPRELGGDRRGAEGARTAERGAPSHRDSSAALCALGIECTQAAPRRRQPAGRPGRHDLHVSTGVGRTRLRYRSGTCTAFRHAAHGGDHRRSTGLSSNLCRDLSRPGDSGRGTDPQPGSVCALSRYCGTPERPGHQCREHRARRGNQPPNGAASLRDSDRHVDSDSGSLRGS